MATANNKSSLIAKYKPYFRYALELKKVSPLVAYHCDRYGSMRAMQLVKKAESEFMKHRYPNNMVAMQAKLQIDMTKQFLEKQIAGCEKNRLEIKEREEEFRMHVENFVLAMMMTVDRREQELATGKAEQS